jgi:hypothetical protein
MKIVKAPQEMDEFFNVMSQYTFWEKKKPGLYDVGNL